MRRHKMTAYGTQAAQAAQIESHKAAAVAGFSLLTNPAIKPEIFLILHGTQPTQAAITAATQAAAAFDSHTHRAAQLTASAHYDRATATEAAVILTEAAAIREAAQRPQRTQDKAKYQLIAKRGGLTPQTTTEALKWLYAAHKISKSDYKEAIKRAAAGQPQRPIISGRLNALMASQAKTGTGQNTISGLNRTGLLYSGTGGTQDSRRRLIVQTDYGLLSVPFKIEAQRRLNNIEWVRAALLEATEATQTEATEAPILAAFYSRVATEAAQHIKNTAVIIPED